MQTTALRPLLMCAVLGVPLVSQTTTVTSPAGTLVEEGSTNNTIPFWSLSSTYQQIHDDNEMRRLNNGGPMLLRALGVRPDGRSTLSARSLDVEITLSWTAVTAQSMQTTFAANFGTNTTVVAPFTNVSLPTATGTGGPNPLAWVVPFATPFPWVPGNGLLWQWRHRNASTDANAAADAVSMYDVQQLPAVGRGCVPTGSNAAATINPRTFDLRSQRYRNVLTSALPNTPALQMIGFAQQTIPVVGLCAPLELVPAVTLAGSTDGTGTWDSDLTGLPNLLGFPRFDVWSQFAWFDAGQSGIPFGVSNAVGFRSPLPGAWNMSRVYAAPSRGGAGHENATTGSFDLGYGLVTGFEF